MSQEHVRILRGARKLIESRKHSFICVAVEKAANGRAEGSEIRAVITRRLAPNGSLEGWLFDRGCTSWEQLCTGNDARQRMRITRLAWIDSLIEEFGGKP